MTAERSKRAIHQMVHTLSYGDAISTEVIALQRVFVEAGFSSAIYAIHVHPHFKGAQNPAVGPIRHYSELQTDASRTAHNQPSGDSSADSLEVVMHYSLGSPLNDVFRALKNAKRSLIYHNLTPAYFFEGVNPRLVRDLRSGMHELPQLAAECDRLIADSAFNAADLRAVCLSDGVTIEDISVLQLLVEPSRWTTAANAGFTAMLKAQPGMNILHVGRMVPNKGYENLIRTFYFIRECIDKQAKLWLVGIDTDSELYSFALKQMVEGWGLSDAVEFLGQRSDCELRALYENSSCYLCLSEHEGFCLPVIEAMHFGLPVVSTTHGALKETIESGGVLVDQLSPLEIAELVGEVVRNDSLRTRVIAAGRDRVSAFSPEQFKSSVQNVFEIGNV